MKYVIINADDFGLSPSVNRGIVEAFQAGGITSTTLMVNMPGFEEAVNLSRVHPELGVGLHFNLTYGSPVSSPRDVPSLVKQDGSFYDIKTACTREERDIEIELNAQWHRFLATGLRPTHLDSHHHIHQIFPAVFRAMNHLAVKENIPMRRSQTSQEAISPSHLKTDHIILDTYDKQDGLHQLLHYLHQLPEGTTEVMCHPGYIDDTLRSISEWTEPREAEMAVYRDPMVKTTYQALGIQPIHFGMLSSLNSISPLSSTAKPPTFTVRRRIKQTRVSKRKRSGIASLSKKKKTSPQKSKNKFVTSRIKVKRAKKRNASTRKKR
ncbi:carbohydrate deacetylase [Paenibacillus aceris]|uniref:Glycoside hydrolase/deacetylase ChbG (UPF0249 family) n=1 Tax=Paenibacillus aceris TaxID=869555 RepID=A0ABS4I0N2_9BACL|nr:carbohydrate deacetylase [Paenibacillus aceris]MBP1964473.1 putative glycoside hydrolase/deacetylase ChbG (UPF0249 family) [Paenibacillus aceris]NHW35815.1 carbohydrate deacetylase [Paenibacillus aceris]